MNIKSAYVKDRQVTWVSNKNGGTRKLYMTKKMSLTKRGGEKLDLLRISWKLWNQGYDRGDSEKVTRAEKYL